MTFSCDGSNVEQLTRAFSIPMCIHNAWFFICYHIELMTFNVVVISKGDIVMHFVFLIFLLVFYFLSFPFYSVHSSPFFYFHLVQMIYYKFQNSLYLSNAFLLHIFFSLLKIILFFSNKIRKKWKKNKDLPSRLIPTAIHFFSRQYWQRLRLIRKMLHCWFFVHGRYWIFCWMDLRKNPYLFEWEEEKRKHIKLVKTVSLKWGEKKISNLKSKQRKIWKAGGGQKQEPWNKNWNSIPKNLNKTIRLIDCYKSNDINHWFDKSMKIIWWKSKDTNRIESKESNWIQAKMHDILYIIFKLKTFIEI